MDENDYMSDGAPASTEEQPNEERDEARTALLPLDFFQGKEVAPGSTCTIKIENVMDDQASVSYVSSSESEESEPEESGRQAYMPSSAGDFMG